MMFSEFQPGTEGIFFDLPANVYREAPGVSQTTIRDFGGYEKPLHFKTAKPRVATADMEFGSINHTATLEPEKLSLAYYVRPETYPAEDKKKGEIIDKKWNGNADFCKQWIKAHSDRPIIDAATEAKIPKIVARLKSLNSFGPALAAGQKEVSYFKRDPITGLLLKCRIDLQCVSEENTTWIFDMKKCQSGEAGPRAFADSVQSLGYHIQAASYLWITGASRFVFVPFDDDVPFDACECSLPDSWLHLGLVQYRALLNRFSECVSSGIWEGYGEGIQTLNPPLKTQKQIKEIVF